MTAKGDAKGDQCLEGGTTPADIEHLAARARTDCCTSGRRSLLCARLRAKRSRRLHSTSCRIEDLAARAHTGCCTSGRRCLLCARQCNAACREKTAVKSGHSGHCRLQRVLHVYGRSPLQRRICRCSESNCTTGTAAAAHGRCNNEPCKAAA